VYPYESAKAEAGDAGENDMRFESLPHADNAECSRVVNHGKTMTAFVALFIASACLALTAAPAFHPAKYRDGAMPPLPALNVVGGGEVMVELDVTNAGVVRGVKALRSTPPYTDMLIATTRMWHFAPAEVEIEPPPPAGQPKFKPVDSTVLVAAVFRAPALIGPTLGELPRDVGSESDSTPYPFSTAPPLFPPRSRDAGLVMIETTISTSGQPTGNRIVNASASFNEAAITALNQWRFRPARIAGSSTPTLAYVIMGFRQPVLGAAPPVPTPR
jgi:TonB family protein